MAVAVAGVVAIRSAFYQSSAAQCLPEAEAEAEVVVVVVEAVERVDAAATLQLAVVVVTSVYAVVDQC